ncbi:MAG TPA: nucleotidyl transferase AbiEii/AbiGii toxin family protein [Thermoanaerobaculia bacterium]|nr:nucleotidyl transferase AbiEii/AbiGii toxin family protein [Thermoanaerobaculia bacterium]
MDLDEALRVLASLEKEGVEYILVGGAAVTMHGLVRATEDLDFFVRPTPENVDRLRKALKAVYNDPSVDEISTEDLLGDYPAVRYYPPEGELFLDIMTRLGEFATYESLEFQEIDYEGVKVRIATPRILYWLKKGTVRDIDRSDAARLKEKFKLGDGDL